MPHAGADNPPSAVVTITGGTGSFGQALTGYLLAQPHGPKVRILSRDEDKQEAMSHRFPPGARMTYILGDVRQRETLTRAFDGTDVVVHGAALKRVPFGERNSHEFTLTNVYGSQNVVTAAIECGVKRSLLIGTDKACAPINAYGLSKALASYLFTQGNSLGVSRGCLFGTVRGGNVWGSRGSVGPLWRVLRAEGKPLQVYGENCTRFHLEMPAWVEFCWRALNEMHGGETLVPKAKAWKLTDLAAAFGCAFEVYPPRPGDKQHEFMVSGDEAARTVDLGWAYAIEPPMQFREVWNYRPWPCPPVCADWRYSSDTVARLTAAELKELAR